jgi:hypothetical protein
MGIYLNDSLPLLPNYRNVVELDGDKNNPHFNADVLFRFEKAFSSLCKNN